MVAGYTFTGCKFKNKCLLKLMAKTVSFYFKSSFIPTIPSAKEKVLLKLFFLSL